MAAGTQHVSAACRGARYGVLALRTPAPPCVRIPTPDASVAALRSSDGTGDPLVPIWHEALYRHRLPFFGKLLHTPITINRYGHCKFTDAEVLAAFAVLVLKVSGYNLLVSGDVLPRPQAQAEFLRLSRRHGASPVLTPPASLR